MHYCLLFLIQSKTILYNRLRFGSLWKISTFGVEERIVLIEKQIFKLKIST